MKWKYYIIAAGVIVAAAVSIAALQKGHLFSNKIAAHRDSTICGTKLPQPRGYVNDYVNLFTEDQAKYLESIIENHEAETTNQIVIVTFDSAMMGRCRLEEYTLAIGSNWGVGQKEKNNGVVIGISPSLRKMRIENGYGIQKILSDQQTKQLIDSVFIPSFREGAYFEGTKNGLLALIEKIK
ncbi:MAG: TPM domain-containing protein [Ferruginibacter sp.]